MFLPGSDLTPLESRKREFYGGPTRWTSEFARATAGAVTMLTACCPMPIAIWAAGRMLA